MLSDTFIELFDCQSLDAEGIECARESGALTTGLAYQRTLLESKVPYYLSKNAEGGMGGRELERVSPRLVRFY